MNGSASKWEQLLGAESVSSLQECDARLTSVFRPETPVVSPQEVPAVQEALRFATAERLRVLPAGGLEHLGWGAALDGCDVILSSRRMNRVLEYETEDLTLVAQAGATLRSIETMTRTHQQRLAPDPWPGVAATLGGACAANRSGLSRLRYGTLRDAVLGARVVHADGTTSRTGGKVVKNVTGYDLAKLYVGSQGSLAFIVELNVRLVPRPMATVLVHAALPFDDARRRIWDLHRSRLQPVSVIVTNQFADVGELEGDAPQSSGDVVDVLVRFEGRASVVEQQANVCKERLDGRVVPAARAPWEALGRFAEPRPASELVQVSAVPTSVFDAIAAARETLDPKVRFVALFGVGTTWLRTPDDTLLNPDAATRLRARLPRGWSLRVVGNASTRCYADVPAPSLQQALKSAFDPQQIFRPMPGALNEASA